MLSVVCKWRSYAAVDAIGAVASGGMPYKQRWMSLSDIE